MHVQTQAASLNVFVQHQEALILKQDSSALIISSDILKTNRRG